MSSTPPSPSHERADFIRTMMEEKATAIWEVVLDDGEAVAMDDGFPGDAEPSAWTRLRLSGRRIRSLVLRFRDHVVRPSPEGAKAYYFSKLATAEPGGPTARAYRAGYDRGDGVFVLRDYDVPSLEFLGERLEGRPEPTCVIRGLAAGE